VLDTSPAASVSSWWIPQRGCCPGARNKWYQSIPGSSWDRVLIPRATVTVGGDRVSILKQRWDCLWDRMSISKQRVDCSRNQFGGVDRFGDSSRVSRGGKDPVFI